MSETAHYKGKLRPTSKALNEYVGNDWQKSGYDDQKEYFDDNFYRTAIEIGGEVYEIDSNKIDPYDDIFEASKNKDGTIDFEVKYHNGGASFSEALEMAVSRLNKDK